MARVISTDPLKKQHQKEIGDKIEYGKFGFGLIVLLIIIVVAVAVAFTFGYLMADGLAIWYRWKFGVPISEFWYDIVLGSVTVAILMSLYRKLRNT